MTPANVIAEVRQLIQDTTSPYRYSDTILLGFVNDVISRMVILRPDLFATTGAISTTADTALQSLPTGAVRLVEIFSTVGGSAITEVDRQTMDRSYPTWMSETSGSPVNFIRHPRNPTKYFLYPPPSSGVTVLAEYVATPTTYALGDDISVLPGAYLSVVVDGTIWLAESVDNEHANSGRAKMYGDTFAAALAVGLKNRAATDREDAGIVEAKDAGAQNGRS